MKTINKSCQIAAIFFGLVSLALFFTSFAEIVTNNVTVNPVGAQLAFGGTIDVDGAKVELAKSVHVLLCFIFTAIAFVCSIFSCKSKTLRYFAPGFGIVASIYTLVIALGKNGRFIDERPLENITSRGVTVFVLFTAIALFVFTILAVAHLLIDDYLEVMNSNGSRKTILKRIGLFFRDYKSETKKIVWPGFKEVVNNTVIVLIMCALVGALIWLFDLGLGKLLNLILGV